MGSEIRVVTYNVLSSHLADPEFYTSCKPTNLLAANRFDKLRRILGDEVANEAIICLQEVSMLWAGFLHVFFASKGYYFITGLYGRKFNGYMGVGIAVPMSRFNIVDADITRIADTKRLPPVGSQNIVLRVLKTIFVSSVLSLLKFTGLYIPKEGHWALAMGRMNQMVSLRLSNKPDVDSLSRQPSSPPLAPALEKSFVVGTYHMPCMFREAKVMSIHCALAAQRIEKFAGKDPYILAGDFNVKPQDSMYRLLTTGELEREDPAFPENQPGDDWSLRVKALRSSYAEFFGKEPEFTNWAQAKESPEFVDTLDYIFLSPGWKIRDVLRLPTKAEVNGPMPTDEQPSDHLLLRANIEMS